MENQKLNKWFLELQNGNARQRRAASYNLSKFGDPEIVPELIRALDDEDDSVRQNAMNGLKNNGSKEALEYLASKGITPSASHKDDKPKNNEPSIIHTIMSIIYVGIIILTTPIFAVFLLDRLFFIFPIWTIGSIIASKIFLHKNNLPIAYVILYSPLIALLYMAIQLIRDLM